MSVFEQLAQALTPHRQALQESIGAELRSIRQLLEHANRISDLGKPDTDDEYLRIIRRGKFPVGENLLGRPKIGEYWLVQMIATNGLALKSPAATLRTSTGMLLLVMLKEGMGQEVFNGSAVILPGEEILFEPEAEGSYDFCLSLIRRKIPQRIPDAYGGIAQGDDINLRAHTGEHEADRYVPDFGGPWSGPVVPDEIMRAGGQPEGLGGVMPEVEEPVGLEPET